jgi:hypothetical protein
MYAAISDEDRYVFLFPCARYIYYIDVSEHQPWRVWGLCGSAKHGTESYEEERFDNDPLLALATAAVSAKAHALMLGFAGTFYSISRIGQKLPGSIAHGTGRF